MKAITIQQPLASLVVKGLRCMDNHTFSTDYRGKLLVHASMKDEMSVLDMPIEYQTEIFNERSFGNIDFSRCPTGAIVGYVELVDIVEPGVECFCNWNGGDEYYRWCFDDFHEFDEPIMGVKDGLGIWEYPEIDENNMPPSHVMMQRHPVMVDDTLWVPLNEKFFTLIDNEDTDKWFMHMVRDKYCMDLIQQNGKPELFTYIGFEFEDYSMRFFAEDIYIEELENENIRSLMPDDKSTGTSHPFLFTVKLHDIIEDVE